jgi:hypothetical protein
MVTCLLAGGPCVSVIRAMAAHRHRRPPQVNAFSCGHQVVYCGWDVAQLWLNRLLGR